MATFVRFSLMTISLTTNTMMSAVVMTTTADVDFTSVVLLVMYGSDTSSANDVNSDVTIRLLGDARFSNISTPSEISLQTGRILKNTQFYCMPD